ncbi:MAG: lysophospholipid acyltransferase family protein [Panacagrimonas sp.]
MLKYCFLLMGYALICLLAGTYRFRVVSDKPARGPDGTSGYILAVWHQNLFAGIVAQSRLRHTVMVSRSRDGDAVAYLCSKMGHRVVRGSSRKGAVDKGGKLAKDEMIEVLKTGMPGAVTVDGPSGPAHEVKPGIIEMARLAGVPIIPYIPIPMRYWSFPSWDAFRLPKPFTRIDIHYGAPMPIGPATPFGDFAQHQLDIAEALREVADGNVVLAPVT